MDQWKSRLTYPDSTNWSQWWWWGNEATWSLQNSMTETKFFDICTTWNINLGVLAQALNLYVKIYRCVTGLSFTKLNIPTKFLMTTNTILQFKTLFSVWNLCVTSRSLDLTNLKFWPSFTIWRPPSYQLDTATFSHTPFHFKISKIIIIIIMIKLFKIKLF